LVDHDGLRGASSNVNLMVTALEPEGTPSLSRAAAHLHTLEGGRAHRRSTARDSM